MFDDEIKIQPKRDQFVPCDLELLSVENMQDYIKELEAEIERVQKEIAKRGDHKAAAESVFKS